MHQSDLPKKRWAQTWTSLKKAQDKIKTGWIWCQIVSQGENAKKVPSYRLIREKFLKLLTPSIKVDNFPRKSTQMWRWDFDDMVPSKLKGLSCSFLKIKFKYEVKNLIFKDQMLSLQQNNQIFPSKRDQAPFSLHLSLLKVMVQYSCRTRMEKVSNITIQVW